MKKKGDPTFFLHDPAQEVFDVPSVQFFTDNVMNVCQGRENIKVNNSQYKVETEKKAYRKRLENIPRIRGNPNWAAVV